MPKLKDHSRASTRDQTIDEVLASAPSPQAGPVWAGPCGAGPQGGITQGLIGRWLTCRERFRLYVIDGLKPTDAFNDRIEVGNLWHTCEEHHAHYVQSVDNEPDPVQWEKPLKEHVKRLTAKYPLQQDQVIHAYDVVRATFPEYVDFWSRNDDVKARTPLLAEQTFDVPYALPSGHIVRLRGKWDSVELVGKGKAARVWLMENKTKSQIDDVKIVRQLLMDLQTMLYVVALDEAKTTIDFEGSVETQTALEKHPLAGVRYNVIRRSAHKATSADARKHPQGFAGHLRDLIRGDVAEASNPADNGWFARWKVPVGPSDVERFRRDCLDGILENICDDYEWWAACHARGLDERNVFDGKLRAAEFPHHCPRHFITPSGVYNPLLEAGGTDLDQFVMGGNLVGLHHATDLFPELAAEPA